MIKARPKGAGWWVFAYGSLLWNPLFPFAEARPAILRGLHRRFCLRSLASRGTPDLPGLVLGLDRGGACTGVAYRLPAPVAMDELHLLWRREMVVGAYRPRWVRVRSGEREIHALTFAVRHAHPQYAGRLSLEEEARVIAGAKGAFGSSLDYLERTRVALVTHGIIDPYLEGIAARVAVLRG
jgi:cation transport protein ChaC